MSDGQVKLYFYYGTMTSAKSLNLLVKAHKKKIEGKSFLALKSSIDSRDAGFIKSRAMPEGIKAINIENPTDILDAVRRRNSYAPIDHIYVDEANFLSPQQVEMLSYIVDTMQIPVTCFGLLTDFRGKLFPGSQRLVEMADTIREISSECACGAKATRNMRLVNGTPTIKGEQILVGGEDTYKTVCRKCYRKSLQENGII